MTYIYSAVVQSQFLTNNDNLAVEITTSANTTIKIRKIRITDTMGIDTTVNDYYKNIKLVTESVAGTAGGAYTPIPVDSNATPSVSTVKINTGAFVVGTVSKTVDIVSVHSGTDFIWDAVDEDDKIVVTPGSIFGVVVNPAN